jgi:hypothetical protein
MTEWIEGKYFLVVINMVSQTSVFSVTSNYSDAPSVASSVLSITSHVPPDTYLNRSIMQEVHELEKKDALRQKLQAFMTNKMKEQEESVSEANEINYEELTTRSSIARSPQVSAFLSFYHNQPPFIDVNPMQLSDSFQTESMTASLRRSSVQNMMFDADAMLAEITAMEREIQEATKSAVRIKEFKPSAPTEITRESRGNLILEAKF